MNDTTPLNALEKGIQDARERRLGTRDLMRLLLASNLAVPSSTPVHADGTGFAPLVFEDAGMPLLVCFSELPRLREYAEVAPHYLRMTGAELLRRMPQGMGLVVNPGSGIGFDLPPDGVAKVLQDLDQLT